MAAAIGDARVQGGGPVRAEWRRCEPTVSVLHLNRAERGENEWWGRELERMRRQWRPRRRTQSEWSGSRRTRLSRRRMRGTPGAVDACGKGLTLRPGLVPRLRGNGGGRATTEGDGGEEQRCSQTLTGGSRLAARERRRGALWAAAAMFMGQGPGGKRGWGRTPALG